MFARKSYTQILLGVPLLLAACSDDKPTAKRPAASEGECDEDELDQTCDECDEGEVGLTFCNESGLVECGCAPEETEPKGSRDAGRRDASRDARTNTSRNDARADVEEGDAATGGEDEDPPPVSVGDKSPKIPEPTEECPELKSGQATIGGLAGITVEVGAKKSGGSLLFYWHGTGQQANEYTRLLPAAVRKEILDQGGIIISPQGSTGRGADCSGTRIFSQGDFEVADLIAACAVKNHGIDPRRIYTTGCSAGGLQAGCMGALRSSYIAAVAPNSGGEVFAQRIQDGSHMPALMTMHGGPQDMVGVSFSQTSKTAGTHYKGAGAFVMNCNHNGAHCLAPAELQSAAWEFMKAHPFGVDPEPYSEVPASFPDYCTIL